LAIAIGKLHPSLGPYSQRILITRSEGHFDSKSHEATLKVETTQIGTSLDKGVNSFLVALPSSL
jgi:hypothetical protein